jgi:hypothetical protein
MRIVIREIHAARTPGELNDEWFVVENVGDRAFSTAGCTVGVSKGKGRLRPIGTLDPGFTLQPQERVRLITGNPGKKAHGKVPEPADDARNYHLFLTSALLTGAGTVVALSLHQHEVVRAVFDPEGDGGIAPEATPDASPNADGA